MSLNVHICLSLVDCNFIFLIGLTRQDSSNLLEKHVVCMCKVVADGTFD